MIRKKLINKWFYSKVTPLGKIFQIYIKGDAVVLMPLIFVLLLFLILGIRVMIIAFLVFFSTRQIGEMFYWILRQLSKPTYRPYDFGLTNLNNKAIYILYQLIAISGATIGITLIIYLIISS